MSRACVKCGAARVKGTLIHARGCLGGAAIVGGEFESAEAHQDARYASEECMENDYQTLKSRGEAR
jgi:hypothetical protein